MNKKLHLALVFMTFASHAMAADAAMFTLPADFAGNAALTITGIVTVLLAPRALLIGWKYLVQLFGKKNA